MKSDPKLRRWYLDLNKRWFGGLLPTETVHLWWEPTGTAAMLTKEIAPAQDGDPPELAIIADPQLYGLPRHTKRDLLHEMCHVFLWPRKRLTDHGNTFQQEMLRLANTGAFKKLW